MRRTEPGPDTPTRSTRSNPPPIEFPDRDYRRLAAFRHSLRLFLRFSEQAARAEGLTPHQHQLLLAVRGWPSAQAPTVSELADQLQLKVHSTSELIQRAAAAGLVTLVADPDDHRRQHVAVTSAGEAKLRALSMLHRVELQRFRLHLSELLDMLGDDRAP